MCSVEGGGGQLPAGKTPAVTPTTTATLQAIKVVAVALKKKVWVSSLV